MSASGLYTLTQELPAHLRDWQLPPGWCWGSEGLTTEHRHYQELVDALGRSLSLVSAPDPLHNNWLEAEARHLAHRNHPAMPTTSNGCRPSSPVRSRSRTRRTRRTAMTTTRVATASRATAAGVIAGPAVRGRTCRICRRIFRATKAPKPATAKDPLRFEMPKGQAPAWPFVYWA